MEVRFQGYIFTSIEYFKEAQQKPKTLLKINSL